LTVDPNLPVYQTAAGISGNLSIIGSDTLASLMTLWAETFNNFYPNAIIQIQAAGSSTAPPAEFLKMILSKEGQKVVIKGGYIPLPAKIAGKYLNELK